MRIDNEVREAILHRVNVCSQKIIPGWDPSAAKIDTVEHPSIDGIVLQLRTYFTAVGQETFRIPATWWDAVKDRWWSPRLSWLMRPPQYTYKKVYSAVCPHTAALWNKTTRELCIPFLLSHAPHQEPL